MNRNHQSRNLNHHTSHGRENVARKQMGSSVHMPSRFNRKEIERVTYQRPSQDFDEYNNNLIDDYSGNYFERSYQGWISHTNENEMDNSNYRSDGPGPFEIEARDKYTRRHLYNPTPDLHGRSFSYRAQTETDDRSFKGVGPKGYVRSDKIIEEEVCELLTHDRYIDASSIYVGVERGVAKLTGVVTDRQQKFAIEDMVESVRGVSEVQNDIKVQRNTR